MLEHVSCGKNIFGVKSKNTAVNVKGLKTAYEEFNFIIIFSRKKFIKLTWL